MKHLSEYLSPVQVSINDLLLDPNNPRFAELGEEIDQVPEHRFAEDGVQKDAFEKMKEPRFNVAELRNTIKELGFLPMDRIVVRVWKGPEGAAKKYVVIEGNRRTTALKWLLELNRSGKETFSDDQVKQFSELEALLLDDAKAPSTARWILPGLRHVSGIKEWGPYQKARTVYELRQTGASSQEAAQSLGLSTREANQLWRAFLALEQMKADEEFGDFAEPRLYSYFEEVFKRPNVREYLGWHDDSEKFIKPTELREFYTWMRGEEDDEGELQSPKLPEAKSIRDLSKILDDHKAMALFRAPEGSLRRALDKFEADKHYELSPTLEGCEAVLSSLSPDSIRALSEYDVDALNSLSNRIAQLLADRQKLTTV